MKVKMTKGKIRQIIAEEIVKFQEDVDGSSFDLDYLITLAKQIQEEKELGEIGDLPELAGKLASGLIRYANSQGQGQAESLPMDMDSTDAAAASQQGDLSDMDRAASRGSWPASHRYSPEQREKDLDENIESWRTAKTAERNANQGKAQSAKTQITPSDQVPTQPMAKKKIVSPGLPAPWLKKGIKETKSRSK